MHEKSSHIAIYLHCLFNGGIEQMMQNLTRKFIERGLKVDLVLNFPGAVGLWDFPPEVRIVDLDARRVAARLPNLIRYLRQNQPVALLSANHYANEVALCAKRLSGVSTRVVVSERTMISVEAKHAPPYKMRYWAPLAAKLFYPMADGIVAVSKGVAEDITNITGLPAQRVQTIYNPVITPALLTRAKEPVDHPWFAPGELPVILGVGRLEEQKDFFTLIRAFAKVRQVKPARLMILGQGSQRSRLQELVRELNLENDVAMPGFVKNPYAYMAKASVFALSSAWEGFGNVVVEALAVKTPVVSTNCQSGPAEILDNGKYGELVPVGDSEAMAAAILKVLSGQSKSAASDWLDQFTFDNAAQKYLDLMGVVANREGVTLEEKKSETVIG
ncbi:glycosyltransferase [Microcoleus sp. FACHB-672]|uniref:glycosyltransferase n=1 Tax=Microcoleus sp. FACHB-672 TaxID=2692825 RepID=UPI00168366A9|nr:glycosyltransferase [Microcoleus sp. FACHB-672]MBD2043728.1 glycosyltransferase [Microcoleus sp. FACHB-672]